VNVRGDWYIRVLVRLTEREREAAHGPINHRPLPLNGFDHAAWRRREEEGPSSNTHTHTHTHNTKHTHTHNTKHTHTYTPPPPPPPPPGTVFRLPWPRRVRLPWVPSIPARAPSRRRPAVSMGTRGWDANQRQMRGEVRSDMQRGGWMSSEQKNKNKNNPPTYCTHTIPPTPPHPTPLPLPFAHRRWWYSCGGGMVACPPCPCAPAPPLPSARISSPESPSFPAKFPIFLFLRPGCYGLACVCARGVGRGGG
jgi:hypothetical protein